MKTEDLVSTLVRDLSPVERDAVPKTLNRALTTGLVGNTVLLVALYGFSSDMPEQILTAMFWIRLVFPLMIIAAAMGLAERLSRPGAPLGFAWLAAIVPIGTMLLMAVMVKLVTPAQYRLQIVLGATSWTTAASVVLLSLPSLAAVMCAMKALAPTRLALAGAGAGLLAGAQGLLVCSLYSFEMSGQFWSIWHVFAIFVTTGIGAGLAPSYLRW